MPSESTRAAQHANVDVTTLTQYARLVLQRGRDAGRGQGSVCTGRTDLEEQERRRWLEERAALQCGAGLLSRAAPDGVRAVQDAHNLGAVEIQPGTSAVLESCGPLRSLIRPATRSR
eukprot:4995306-Prymnesium_polylepis.2